METLSQIMNEWRKEGYTHDISVDDNLNATVNQKKYPPEELQLDKKKRFEGDTNPADMSILFAVSHKNDKLGLIVDSFNPKEETSTSKFLKKIK